MKTTDTVLADSLRLIDVTEVAKLTRLSRATIWRHHEDGIMPRGLKIGRSVRWRLRTGDRMTGIADWIEAGCPQCDGASRG